MPTYELFNPTNDGRTKWAFVDCPFPEQDATACCTFVYSDMTEHWLGKFSYNFDKYLVMDDTTIYGMRQGRTFLLNDGDQINGIDVVASVLTAASPAQVNDKEFLRIRINADNKPTLVEFFTNMDDVDNEDAKAILDPTANPLALKDYYGFEQYVPRRIDNGDRMQGRVMLYRITHQGAGIDFTLVDTEIQFKQLK